MDIRPIGIFDSGIGGLTVLKKLEEKLPNERFIYLGDTKFSLRRKKQGRNNKLF